MTDAELIARLRNPDPDSIWSYEMGKAADRIEAIEAKLAKAVEELEQMLMVPNSEAAQGILKVFARALLAELKGESHE